MIGEDVGACAVLRHTVAEPTRGLHGEQHRLTPNPIPSSHIARKKKRVLQNAKPPHSALILQITGFTHYRKFLQGGLRPAEARSPPPCLPQ
jgi:hypothetical protein